MNWTEIKIEISAEDVEIAENIANMVVPYGIYIEDYSNLEDDVQKIAHIDLIDEDLLKKDREKSIIHIYLEPQENPSEAISFLKERLNSEKVKHEILTSACDVEKYINNWKKYFKPLKVGKKILICPTWEKMEPCEDIENRKILKLDPGLAFGTGSHETTRLCLEMLEDEINGKIKVLDLGCGSGILSIVSLILGAESATGVDIDELAVKTAIENAKLNDVESKFEAKVGDLDENVSGQFDVVVANIVADVLIRLNEKVSKYLVPGGVYILSGIIDEREQDVIESIPKDFKILEHKFNNGWVALKLKRL